MTRHINDIKLGSRSRVLRDSFESPSASSCGSTFLSAGCYKQYFLLASSLHPIQSTCPFNSFFFFISIPCSFKEYLLNTCYVLNSKLGTPCVHSVEQNRHVLCSQGLSDIVGNLDIKQINIHIMHYNYSNNVVFLLTQ